MIDAQHREIHYLRLSLTDRCNLRCRYCMPNGVPLLRHDDLLTYEELLRVCEAAVSLGITSFRVTGGEPLVRRGCLDFLARLRRLPGVGRLTLTTNGVRMDECLPALAALPVDGVNVSLDTLDDAVYERLTGAAPGTLARVLRAVERGVALGVPIKVNAVLTEAAFAALPGVLALAQRLPVDVRLIELMPIGEGARERGVSSARALALCQSLYPDLRPAEGARGDGPARYYRSGALLGAVGIIDAVSHSFCATCNRVRLTPTGLLKPCLCYGEGAELRPLLRGGASGPELALAMRNCIYAKPASHCFDKPACVSERASMNQIGG